MPGPPPPPPPMPNMGRGPPAPPPPPMGSSRPPAKGAGRGALLSSIESGTRLKKVTQVNDRSAPVVSKASNGPAAPMASAPPIPGVPSRPAPGGLAPPLPGQRGRSSSDGGQDGGSLATAAPQLAGLFAGGMPKLRKTSGAVDTGADKPSYLSDPEHGRHAQRASTNSAPLPPRVPGSLPPRPPGAAPGIPQMRPYSVSSASSTSINKPKPPPLGKKPPLPPPSSRKLSGSITPSSASFSSPLSPPPPPPTASRPAPAIPNGNSAPSLAQQAALNAFSRNHTPAAPPPPPPSNASPRQADEDYDPYNHLKSPTRLPPAPSAPPPRPMSSAPPPPLMSTPSAAMIQPLASPSALPPPPPPPPPSQAAPRLLTAQITPPRSMLDISASRPVSTQSNGNRSSSMTMSTTRTNSSYISESPRALVRVQDSRWRFTDDSQLSKPRDFVGIPKRYRAGRVSTVPLDLDSLGR